MHKQRKLCFERNWTHRSRRSVLIPLLSGNCSGYIGKENMDWHWILVVFENCITKKMFSCQLFLRHVELLLLMLLVYVRIGTTWMGLLFLFWSFELDGILLYYCWKFWVILEIVPLWLYDINFYIRKLSASGGIFCC